MTKSMKEIARELAIDAKAGGFEDFGCLYYESDHGHLTETEWEQVCDMAEAMMPTVRVPAERRAAWAKASREFAAEQVAEQRAFCPH